MAALVPVESEHHPFLFDLYCSTREAELSGWGWPPEQKAAFLRMQFDVRQRAYKMQFPQAEQSVILHIEQAVGQLTVDRSQDVLLLVDISIIPGFRSRGIGTSCIQRLQEEARRNDSRIRLHVQKVNRRARALYDQLGFEVHSEGELDWLMEWAPH